MRLKNFILSLALMLAFLPSHAQLRLGIKGGVAVNKLHFNKSLLNSENQSGFTGGLQLELSLPVTGLGVNGALMYTHRNDALSTSEVVYRRDFIELPVHVKYGFNLLGLNKLLVPYAFTGPNFSFLFNESSDIEWDNRASNTAWDVGFGIELVNHLQIEASYSIGLTEAFKQVGINKTEATVKGRDKCWTVTAAYMF